MGSPSSARSLPVVSADAPRSTSTSPAARFESALAAAGVTELPRHATTTLQVNLGKHCNMACLHCHVDAGPNRTERMSAEVLDRVLALLDASPSVRTVDVTGGAPELHPGFRALVTAAHARGLEIIDRCNLTVLLEPGQEDTAAFLAAHGVRVVASLPCYGPENLEKQRGRGAFDKSIEALRRLNALGYGVRPGLTLELVYNPVGPSLPPAQAALEARYREELARGFGVQFDRLLTLTNLPIARFAHALERDGQLEGYLAKLEGAFNPATLPHLMCRALVSVAYDGALHDCDFHQMATLPLGGHARTVFDVDSLEPLTGQPVALADHCLGCTAGAGSSCGGALA